MIPLQRFAAAVLVASLWPAQAYAQRRLTIGIVSGQLGTASQQSFKPFTTWLETNIPGTRFEMVPLPGIQDLVSTVEQRKLDFAFATPAALVELNVRAGARAIATVLQPVAGHGDYPWLAGAVFVKASRSDITRLEDIRGHRVVALSPLALGGWLSAELEWRHMGILTDRDLGSLRFVFSYERLVQEVCADRADAGILSVGTLMQFAPLCGSPIRVLPNHRGGRDPRYPAIISTDLYPEEAFAVVGNVEESLVSKVEIALLAIQPGSPAARAAIVSGFTAPLSYASVQQLMEELRLPPFQAYGRLSLRQAIGQYWLSIVAVLGVFLAIVAGMLVRTRRLNSRLTISETFRRRVFEGSHVPVVVMDAESWRYVDANPAAISIYGFSSPQEITRKTVLDVSAPSQYDGAPSDEKIRGYIGEALAKGSTVFEWRHQRPDGTHWDAEVHLMSFLANQRTLLQFTLQDITMQKRVEAERARLEEQLRQSQKLESIGRLAGGIAHDFNNLLTVINGYADMLVGRAEMSPRCRLFAEEVQKAGTKAAELTHQLLAFSKHQLLQPVPMDLNKLVRDSEAMFGRLLGEDVQLGLDLADSPAMVMADPGQIHQILMNLVANARDAMPNGGKLTIRTERWNKESSDCPDEIPVGVYWVMEVSDTGSGMDDATKEHIFEPFFSTKGDAGTGLGLSTVYGIVRQSRGAITVTSQPGHGTSLRIYLPETDQQAEPTPSSRNRIAREKQKAGATILLVEDQDNVRAFAREILAADGYRVVDAASGEAALSAARGLRHGIDLLFTDVVLQGMDGLELSERCLELHPNSKVLFTSGYTENAIVRRRLDLGGISLIAKPYSPADLLATVSKALAMGG